MPIDNLLTQINLDQFDLAPSQVWGNIRLVPVIKENYNEDLRLGLKKYDAEETYVYDAKTVYCSYIPHGMIARWSSDNKPVVPYGCELSKRGKSPDSHYSRVQIEHRMVKKENSRQVRFLPLHLAMEGFLSLCFGGPNIAWSEYSKSVLKSGLGSRSEKTVAGIQIRDLEDALRVFEVHDKQVGVIIFVADSPASIFLVPHPADYRLMHASLIEDFYGELIFYNGLSLYNVPELDLGIENLKVNSLDDLETLSLLARKNHQHQHDDLLRDMILPKIESRQTNRLGKFSLQRFMTDLDNNTPNFIGEALLRVDGSIEYMKTYQLSRAQAKRGFLLKSLAKNDWDLEQTALSLACHKNELILRLNNAGFGYFIKPDILAAALKASQH
ncbi:hypothetical protein MNBD_GAMMA12-1954 [hydrothermal vent metagenome]|uniref:ARG and Rhodanese-Phosphatase-superfamily-associated domain-containing protein n=1 Tax=hydrothermal vent metagenome TaxID=652676 RepID=A0A3B0YLZ3_9ZZZZ